MKCGPPAHSMPGRLKEVKGIGWYIDEYGVAQISVNLTNYKTSTEKYNMGSVFMVIDCIQPFSLNPQFA